MSSLVDGPFLYIFSLVTIILSFFNAFVKIVNEKYDSKNIKNYLKSNYDWEIIVARFIKILKNK